MSRSISDSGFFAKLPEEIREKLKNCRTEEEAMDILRSEMIEMPDDMMDEIAGGSGYCPEAWGDSRDDVSYRQISRDFEEGRITGENFF